MSKQAQQRVPLSQVANVAPRGGPFLEDTRFNRSDANFVPWSPSSFKTFEPPRRDEAPESDEGAAPEDPSTEAGREADAQSDAAAQAAASQAEAELFEAPPPPPPEPVEPPPNPEEIIAAIETAREDGRAKGYKQGYDAAHREVADALSVLRKLAGDFTTLAEDATERNAEIMARHVRRLAQDLFGAVFAEMPDRFVERIKSAAASFTKAGGEFTLSLNPHDHMSLSGALKGEALFRDIRVEEDIDLAPGSFRLSSRELEYEDSPSMLDERERE
jgi:flagellar biosynthesis/type III secretory pathway protein FliH